MSALELLTQGDALSRGVAALLLAMSIASWVVILWKAWLLRGGTRDVARSTAAFWQARTLDDARQRVAAFDRAGLVQMAPGCLFAIRRAELFTGAFELAGRELRQPMIEPLVGKFRQGVHCVPLAKNQISRTAWLFQALCWA